MSIIAAITAFFVYVGEVAVTYFAGLSIQSIVTNLIISWAMNELLGEEFEDLHKGTLLNKSANNAPIPVIYGVRKVGGVRSFVGTSGSDNTYLWVVLTISEGEIEAIDDIYIDDVLLNSSSKHWSNTVVTKYTGTDAQTAHSDLVAANIGWTSNHRLRGLAYVVCRFTWDRDIFSSIPTIHALVRGKKVLDPRDSSTAYSSNPALCLRDYLTNARYGKGLPASSIDDTLFGAAATKCETQVTPYSGASQQNLFDCSMVLNTDKTLIDNTKELMSGCRGLMPYQGGKFGLIIEDQKTGNAVFNFTTDHIIGGITIESEKKSTKYNRAIMTFANPDKNWQTDTIDWPAIGSSAHNTYLAEDNNVDLVGRLSLPTITNVYTAIDIAELVVKRSRAGLKVVMQCTSEALKCQVGDIVTITHPTPGWTAKEFRVMLTSLMPSGTVTLNLVEHQDNIYPWGTKTEAASSPSTNLPDPFVVSAPTNLAVNVGSSHYLVQTDGSVIVRSQVTFTASVDKFVERYIVQWKYAGDSVYANDIILTGTVGYISGFKTGETIDVRVKSVSTVGVSSAYLIVTGTSVTAHATAPGVPGSLTATARQGAIELSWTNPSNTDFAYVEINRHTANSQANSSLFLKTSNTTVVDQVGEGLTRYYFARAFNRSGVASAWSSVASATSLSYPAAAAPKITHNGLVYYSVNQANAPSTPSATGYNFSTGVISGLTSGWSLVPPTLDIGASNKYWSSAWSVLEATSGGGTGVPAFLTAQAQFTFDGVVTFTNSNSVTDGTNTVSTGGLLAAGGAAADINANSTKIDGGKITANTIIANVQLTGAEIDGGTIQIGTGSTTNSRAFEVLGTGGVEASYIGANQVHAQNVDYPVLSAIFGESVPTSSNVSVYGLVNNNCASTAAHAVRGTNSYIIGSRVQTSGLVGAANNYDFYAEGAGTNYGPFTGAHDCLVANDENVFLGDLVVDVQCVARRGLSNTLFSVETSSQVNQAAVLGVIVADNGALYTRQPAAFIKDITDEGAVMADEYNLVKNDYKLMAVNAVGEGQINVIGQGGNLSPGDLIVASSTAGKGMKQTDDFVRSYTVARARESVSFDSPGEVKMVACIYLCG
jgi:fibronectin type 3 domain-containing protein